MDRAWHEAHRLGQHASRPERVAWHAEHEQVCSCREPPADLHEEIEAHRAAHPSPATSDSLGASGTEAGA